MRRSILCGLGLALALSTAPAFAQTAPDVNQTEARSDAEIVVEGRTVNPKDLPVRVVTPPRPQDRQVSAASISDARRFVRCMHSVDPRLLHETIDRALNDRTAQWALDRLIRQRSACYSTVFARPPADPPKYGECNPIYGSALCRNVFDRGVLFEYALATYAPDLTLNRADLRRDDVRRQFLQRERPISRNRTSDDRRYFDVVSCVVQTHPEMAVAFIRLAEGDAKEAQLRQLLVGLSSNCFGRAKKVAVDPNQFRLYVGEAVYSWAAAVRGLDSLIPHAQQARID